MIRTLIVDDEPLARRHLATLLAAEADFAVISQAENGSAAIDMISELRPDLVFLDIQMPEITGFDVIEVVGVASMPTTVFVTAYDAFALKAFEVQALDYLLKPFDDRRFSTVLSRIRANLAGPGKPQRLDALLGNIGRPPMLAARANGVVRLIRLDEIDWIAAAGDYAEVHAGGRAMLLNESLTSLEARLPKGDFARVHRSAIVRLDRLAEIRSGSHGDGTLLLSGGKELRFSRRYRAPLGAFLRR
jgi:two-component system LytT family response regulator